MTLLILLTIAYIAYQIEQIVFKPFLDIKPAVKVKIVDGNIVKLNHC